MPNTPTSHTRLTNAHQTQKQQPKHTLRLPISHLRYHLHTQIQQHTRQTRHTQNLLQAPNQDQYQQTPTHSPIQTLRQPSPRTNQRPFHIHTILTHSTQPQHRKNLTKALQRNRTNNSRRHSQPKRHTPTIRHIQPTMHTTLPTNPQQHRLRRPSRPHPNTKQHTTTQGPHTTSTQASSQTPKPQTQNSHVSNNRILASPIAPNPQQGNKQTQGASVKRRHPKRFKG